MSQAQRPPYCQTGQKWTISYKSEKIAGALSGHIFGQAKSYKDQGRIWGYISAQKSVMEIELKKCSKIKTDNWRQKDLKFKELEK